MNVSIRTLPRYLGGILIGVILGMTLTGRVPEAAPHLDRIEPQVARILTYRKDEATPLLGTGFWIKGLPYLVTNYHVIDGYDTIQVLTAKSANRLNATEYYRDTNRDIALLEVEGTPPTGLVLSPREQLPKGMRVWALGYPGAADRGFFDENISEATLTAGIINRTLHQAWETGQERFLLIQHDAKLSHGNSGGPLLDDCGQLIGINTQIQLAATALETYSYALSAYEIQRLLDEPTVRHLLAQPPIQVAWTCAPESPAVGGPMEFIWLGILLSSALIFLVSLFVMVRRPRVLHIVESYSRYLRRMQSDIPQEAAHDDATHVWTTLSLRREGDVPITLRSLTSQRKTFTVGRSHRQADYFLDDKTVSRCHVRFTWEPRLKHWMVEDLHSRNGTRLEGKSLLPYQQMPLKHDMQLSIGKVLFTVQLISGAVHLATSPAGVLSREAANQSQIHVPPMAGNVRFNDPDHPMILASIDSPPSENDPDPSTAAPFEVSAMESHDDAPSPPIGKAPVDAPHL